MGLFDGLFNIGKKAVSVLSMTGTGNATWSERNYMGFAEQAYKNNPVGFRCVDLIASGIGSVPLKVYRGTEPDPEHPLQKLLNRPNPTMAGSDFFKSYVSFRAIAGNAFLEATRATAVSEDGAGPSGNNARGNPLELWLWEPFTMRVLHDDKNPIPMGYQRQNQDGSYETWLTDRDTKQSNILHWKTFSPTDKWMGLPPLHPAGRSVDQHNESSEWNQYLLQQSGKPSGMFSGEGLLNDANIKQIKEDIDSQYEGKQGVGRPLLLDGSSIKYTQLSMSPTDLDWMEGRNSMAREICSSIGVPSQLLSIPGDQTYANFAEARIALWDDTIIPWLDSMVGELNYWLVPMYGEEDITIKPDLSQVPAMDDKRASRMAALESTSFLTVNEKREEIGYAEYDGDSMDAGDLLYSPSGQLPLGFGFLDSDMGNTEEDEAKMMKLMGADLVQRK